MNMKNKTTPPKSFLIAVYSAIGLVLLLVIVIAFTPSDETPELPKVATFSDKVRSQFSPLDGEHRKLKAYIKSELLTHPDSYEHLETTLFADSASNDLVVTTRFTSKNDYGMAMRYQVIADVDAETGEVLKIISAN